MNLLFFTFFPPHQWFLHFFRGPSGALGVGRHGSDLGPLAVPARPGGELFAVPPAAGTQFDDVGYDMTITGWWLVVEYIGP